MAVIEIPEGLDIWCRDCMRPAIVAVDRVPLCSTHAKAEPAPETFASEDEYRAAELASRRAAYEPTR